MFAFRLARELGVWNVDDMLKSMSSRQLSEWMAFFVILERERKEMELEHKARSGVEARRMKKK